ncbi:MAG: methyltransferase domain-containing protein [Chloroflexi bacterium]|nr:methyltransferase domain-containing protein [Chloroflexota bacterium]
MTQPIRRQAVARLRLEPGDVVLDVGCGTGLSFPLILARIGSEGQLVGIELSPDMMAKARERVESSDWQNVTLIESPVEEAQIPDQVDAVLFHFTHDILRSPQALENVFQHVKRGGRVAAAGTKWAPWWAFPVNFYVWSLARRYVTTLEGFARPWSHLLRTVPDLRVEPVLFGGGYIAWGTVPKG